MKPLVSVTIVLVLASLPAVAIAQVPQTYQYDANGRLTGVSTTGSAGTNTAAYVYDDADNRTSRSQTGATTWAALSRLPVGQLLQSNEALVSPDGRYSLALRPSGQVELEAAGRGTGQPSFEGLFVVDSAGAARFQPGAALANARQASLVLTNAGELILVSDLSGADVLWRWSTATTEGF